MMQLYLASKSTHGLPNVYLTDTPIITNEKKEENIERKDFMEKS